jgi:hypothetical protein
MRLGRASPYCEVAEIARVERLEPRYLLSGFSRGRMRGRASLCEGEPSAIEREIHLGKMVSQREEGRVEGKQGGERSQRQ